MSNDELLNEFLRQQQLKVEEEEQVETSLKDIPCIAWTTGKLWK